MERKIRTKLEKNTTRAKYTYNWNLDQNDNPIITFYIEKFIQEMVINGLILFMKF